MKYVLSIQLGHNATIAISDGQKIIGSISQEKLDNIKNSSSFPSDAILALFKYHSISSKEILKILICGLQIYPPNPYDYVKINNKIIEKNFIANLIKIILKKLSLKQAYNFLRGFRQKKLNIAGKKYLRDELKKLNLDKITLTYVNHHQCHLFSAICSASNMVRDSLVITIDGAGDGESSTVSLFKDGVISKISKTEQFTSLGNFYSGVTRFLGMTPLEHEYKVMGLAPYANQKYVNEIYNNFFKDLITIDPDNRYKFISKIDCFDTYDYLVKNCSGYRFDNIAAAAQLLIENLVIKLIKNLSNDFKIYSFYFGGGVFMNVKLNMKIQNLDEVHNSYFMPSCGDESNPIGALYYDSYMNKTGLKPISNLYLGLSFEKDEIKNYLSKLNNNFIIEQKEDLECYLAKILSEDKILARFSGRGEFGARSLGNRAILANPKNHRNFYKINNYIKSRDFWMPFAPTILFEHAHKYLVNFSSLDTNSNSMITAFEGTERAKEDFAAAIHPSDGTLRPQVLKKDYNPNYYHLIEEFYKVTGIPGLLNTSFNLHGYPMVSSLEQAFFAFTNSDLEYLVIENFVITKK